MQYTLTGLPGGLTITGDVGNEKELFQVVSFWQSLPAICPIDGTPTVLSYREPGGNAYFGLTNTGPKVYEFKIGQHKNGNSLFAKNQWTYYDGEKEVVVWENGRVVGEVPSVNGAAPKTNGNGAAPKMAGSWTTDEAMDTLFHGSASFSGADDAMAFAVAAGAWGADDVGDAYRAVKENAKPKSAGDMWTAWMNAVAAEINKQRRKK